MFLFIITFVFLATFDQPEERGLEEIIAVAEADTTFFALPAELDIRTFATDWKVDEDMKKILGHAIDPFMC